VRDAPATLGLGYVEQAAAEMSAELAAIRLRAQARAQMSHARVEALLVAKGVRFGRMVVAADGESIDWGGLEGVDPDLVVKPFGWKGRVASLRRFVEEALRTHLGIQSEPLIAEHCQHAMPALVGDGADCHDPDRDGVTAELTEGQLSALSIYMALQPVPIRVPPEGVRERARALEGERLFEAVGCESCHVRELVLTAPHREEVPDLTGGRPFEVDLARDVRPPPPRDPADQIRVELFSDLKRHDLGPELADPRRASFAPGIAPGVWLTRPLWGVGVTPPYLHDGRAASLEAAIRWHGGEARPSRDRFGALSPRQRAEIVEFLQTLRRIGSTHS
jgi:CxxC motif-containing protein (DUF1111 family)